MATRTARLIRANENPNAVCAICRLASRKEPKLVAATHEVTRPDLRYFACDWHTNRALAWDRAVRLAEELRRRVA
jgi:hypothetical protein